MQIFAGIAAFFEAIPILNSWLQSFVAFYVSSRIDAMKAENRDAIKHAIELHDQRELEKAIGNTNAGEPSNIPGTSERDSLPGVH